MNVVTAVRFEEDVAGRDRRLNPGDCFDFNGSVTTTAEKRSLCAHCGERGDSRSSPEKRWFGSAGRISDFVVVRKRVRGRLGEVAAGRIVRGMTQVRLEPGAIVELHHREVLIVHLHRLFVSRTSVTDPPTDSTAPKRGNRGRREPKIREDALTFLVAEIRPRFEENDVNDQR